MTTGGFRFLTLLDEVAVKGVDPANAFNRVAAVSEAGRGDPDPHLSAEIRRCVHALSRPKGTG